MARGKKIARQLFVDHDSVTGDEDEEDDVPNSDDSDRLVVISCNICRHINQISSCLYFSALDF